MRRGPLLAAILAAAAAVSWATPEQDKAQADRQFQALSSGLPEAAPPVKAPSPQPLDEQSVPADLQKESQLWNTGLQLSRLPLADLKATFNFVVIGDAEPGRFIWERGLWGEKGVFRKQIKAIASEPAAFVLQLGDMVSRGIAGNYRLFYADLDDANLAVPYLTTVGNHDRHWPHGDTDHAMYDALFGKSDYSFDVGGWRFVSLDSSGEKLTGAQLDWLDHVLDTKKHKVVYTHMPPKTMKEWTLGVTGISEGADRYMDILSKRRVDRVYVGHIHGYGIARFKGVNFVLSGCGGSPLYPMPVKRFYHYITASAGPEGLTETVHPLESAPFEIAWPQGGDFIRLDSKVPAEDPSEDQ